MPVDVASQLHRSFSVLDFEATSTSPQHARIVEWAVVEFRNLKPHSRSFSLVDPGVPIPPESTAIHGIRDRDVAAASVTVVALQQLLPRIASTCLVGFNIGEYDWPLLAAECRRCDVALSSYLPVSITDVFQWLPRHRGRSLSATTQRLGIEHTKAHNAVADAEATGWVLVELLRLGVEVAEVPGWRRVVY